MGHQIPLSFPGNKVLTLFCIIPILSVVPEETSPDLFHFNKEHGSQISSYVIIFLRPKSHIMTFASYFLFLPSLFLPRDMKCVLEIGADSLFKYLAQHLFNICLFIFTKKKNLFVYSSPFAWVFHYFIITIVGCPLHDWKIIRVSLRLYVISGSPFPPVLWWSNFWC